LLIAANNTFNINLLEGLQINSERATKSLFSSPSIATALIPYIGYHKAGDLAQKMKQKSITIFEANEEVKAISAEKLEAILTPSNLLKTGFKPGDVTEERY
ncbi:MAG: hypothetical protein R6U85_12400, partial [Salinivirgaceae bacterium]